MNLKYFQKFEYYKKRIYEKQFLPFVDSSSQRLNFRAKRGKIEVL
ncbi:hypothetical protein LEP1GSC008_1626 [Leptospira kirschneri serovar Bulgarica str. Nikolaevo]|uniref:Uncharacterized protein n=1 Tax=Leptospira kirschneri serovar Bulgarica str. Nikolaevo TaxID=1240687 RepID=M6F7D0_9LEPT|nr:hypothetical protein LEP1GSC008_1626 [Leptospira kirschneri serovar Bulgarica str. Nikolaevo]